MKMAIQPHQGRFPSLPGESHLWDLLGFDVLAGEGLQGGIVQEEVALRLKSFFFHEAYYESESNYRI